MTNFIYYLIGLFVVAYIPYFIGERALKHLNTEQKAGLINMFAKDRKYGSAAIFFLVIAFLVVLQFKLVEPLTAFSLYFAAMILYVVFKNYRTYVKLTANNYPKVYSRKVLIADIVSTIGILLFLGLMFFESFAH
jgi:hypothetical protein